MDVKKLKAIRGIQQNGFIASPEHIRDKCIFISTVRKMTQDEKEKNLRAIVIDDADGVYVCRKGSLVYSWRNIEGEEDIYYVSSANSTMFGTYELVGERRIPLELETIKNKPYKQIINIFEEDLDMALDPSIASKLQGVAEKTNATVGGTAEVKAFTPEASATPVATGITQADSQEMANVERIAEFARKHGEALFYITNKEPELNFKAKKVFEKDAEGRYIPADPSNEEVARKLRSSNSKEVASVKASEKASHYSLILKQDRPTQKFLVYSVPGGLADLRLENFAQILDGKLDIDMNNTEKVLKVVPRKFIPHVINTTFGGEMPESPLTHGNCASVLRVKQVQGAIKQGKANISGSAKKLSVVFDKAMRSSQLMDGNFFPLQVAKKISLSLPHADDAELHATIQGAFSKLFTSRTSLGSRSQYDLLSVEHKALLSQNPETGEISTKLINPQGSVNEIKENLEIIGWNKDIKPSEIDLAIPARTMKQSKGKTPTYPAIYFDCTSAKARNDEAYAAQTSLNNGKYAKLVEEFGNVLNVGRLQKLTKATRKSTSQEDIQSSEKQRFDAVLASVNELKGLVSGESEDGMSKAEVSRFLDIVIK